MTMDSDDPDETTSTSSEEETDESSPPSGSDRLTDQKSERGLTKSLLDCDESFYSNETFLEVMTVPESESMSPWALMVPNPTFNPTVPKKKPTKTQDDSVVPYGSQYAWRHRSFDFDIRDPPLWKQCIEPHTYRYVPHNRKYHQAKVDSKQSTPQPFRKTLSVDRYITPEQKQLQREIQRALRKEFENQQQAERQKSQLERQKSIIENDRKRLERTLDNPEVNNEYGSPEHDSREESHMQNQERDSETNRRKILESRIRSPINLPPIDVPLVGKSLSDKYMESFSKRINALDAEMKRDMTILRRNSEMELRTKLEGQWSSSDIMNVPPKEHSKGQWPSSDIMSKERTKERVSDETFSVRPVGNQRQKSEQARPRLEETPYNKQYALNYENTSHNKPETDRAYFRYGVGQKEMEKYDRYMAGTSSAPPAGTFYDRDGSNLSDDYGPTIQYVRGPTTQVIMGDTGLPRAFRPQNMTKSPPNSRQKQQDSNAKLKESQTKSNKSSKQVPKTKTAPSIPVNNPGAKVINNNFTAVPLGKAKARQKDKTETQININTTDLLHGISGKRVGVSLTHHRLL